MKILRSTIFALGLLLVVSGAYAQSTQRVAGKVPFDFVVGNQVFPAGDSTLAAMDGMPQVLAIHDVETSDTRVTLTNSVSKLNPAEKTVLVFHRIGNQY